METRNTFWKPSEKEGFGQEGKTLRSLIGVLRAICEALDDPRRNEMSYVDFAKLTHSIAIAEEQCPEHPEVRELRVVWCEMALIRMRRAANSLSGVYSPAAEGELRHLVHCMYRFLTPQSTGCDFPRLSVEFGAVCDWVLASLCRGGVPVYQNVWEFISGIHTRRLAAATPGTPS